MVGAVGAEQSGSYSQSEISRRQRDWAIIIVQFGSLLLFSPQRAWSGGEDEETKIEFDQSEESESKKRCINITQQIKKGEFKMSTWRVEVRRRTFEASK